MKSLQQYRIPYTGLKPGVYNFHFEVDYTFFDEFEYSLVKSGKLNVDLEFEKQETLLILQFHISGEIKCSCDVCLADYPTQINIEERQIAKFTNDENLEDDTEEIIVLTKNDHEVDVSTLIYEYINLAVPYISRCEDEGNTKWCDKEMIAKLDSLSGRNEQETDDADPRWEALKNIKKQ